MAVAIVGQPYTSGTGPTQTTLAARDLRPEHRTTTFLSDGCSDVFAPGWDVTFAEQGDTRFYATFGLGSPFPEDVKLCAAANAFWPAASPDAARPSGMALRPFPCSTPNSAIIRTIRAASVPPASAGTASRAPSSSAML